MKVKSKHGGYFRINSQGKWARINAPIQGELDFNESKPNILPIMVVRFLHVKGEGKTTSWYRR